MALLRTWTTRCMINVSRWLAGAFGFEAAQPTAVNNSWTADSLAKFGLTMSKGFGIGL